MRVLAAVLLVVALAGCAPYAAAGTQRVELEGRISQFTASASDGSGWLIELDGLGMLALDVGDTRPPIGAAGVTVEVPASLDLDGSPAERFHVLEEYAVSTGVGLVVVEFF